MNVREDSVACSWVEGEPIPPGDFSPGHKPQKPIYPKKKKKERKKPISLHWDATLLPLNFVHFIKILKCGK